MNARALTLKFFLGVCVKKKPKKQYEAEIVSRVSYISMCVVLRLLPYSVRDLISSAGLITQQMGTECSVTKTKTNPQLDYASACVYVCVCVLSD